MFHMSFPSSEKSSLSIVWQAGRHRESVFTLEVPGNEFPHTSLICLINL